jgi:hypothetical protein
MWLRSLLKSLKSRPSVATFRRPAHRPHTPRLGVEALDDRCLPSTFTVTNLLDTGAGSLREAVVAANANPGADSIDFAVTGTIALTSGQLDITDSVTINGPGADALIVSGNYISRVFGIAGDPTVLIAGLTVANGALNTSATDSRRGGGISMAGGTVTLDHVTVSGNYAVGVTDASGYGGGGLGGGLYVAGGTLTLDQCTVSGNSAVGAPGLDEAGLWWGPGGSGAGGGLCIAGGTVHVNQSIISENHAIGGHGSNVTPIDDPYTEYGGYGGYGMGGGIYVTAGRLEVGGSTVSGNTAAGGYGGWGEVPGYPGRGEGGGLYISPYDLPPVNLDTFTESNTIYNIADVDPNISGPYTGNGSSKPALAINDASTLEGNTGTHAITFTVSLSAASNQTITVAYTTVDGNATAGSDYQAASGWLTIPAGQTSATFTVAVKGDRLPEPTETFAVNLSAATSATISDAQAIGTIVDDEPRISISDVTKNEGKKGQTTSFTFTVTLSTAYDQPVTMSFQTVNGTAKTSDNDYIAKSGTITFLPGETSKTITIEVKGDSKKEATEYFYLDLFGNSTNSLFTKNRGVGTILNDD